MLKPQKLMCNKCHEPFEDFIKAQNHVCPKDNLFLTKKLRKKINQYIVEKIIS